MKLYIYDHCPFCVRARMIVGLRQLSVENVILLNDDEDTPIGLIGVKQVPILIKPDQTAMGESLDIVRYLDELAGQERLIEQIRPEIQAWADSVGKYYGKLIQPRYVEIGLPEFATEAAKQYYITKKAQDIGDFGENIANTPELLGKIMQDLVRLENLIQANHALNGELSMEDIIIFPMLRNLTVVKDLVFPEKVLDYIQTMAKNTQINTYFSQAW